MSILGEKLLPGGTLHIHIAGNAGVLIDPPRPSNASLAIKDPELIKAELRFQATPRCYARLPGTNNENGIKGIASFVGSIPGYILDRFGEVCHLDVQVLYLYSRF